MNKEFYTVVEASKILNIRPGTVRRMLVENIFPNAFKAEPVRTQSAWKIPANDINHFLEKQKKQSSYTLLLEHLLFRSLNYLMSVPPQTGDKVLLKAYDIAYSDDHIKWLANYRSKLNSDCKKD